MNRYAKHTQRGAVLIVGLIMVLLMTTIGLAAIRGSGMQEMMAGNVRDRNLAFQAAEAGLREAEKTLGDLDLMPPFDGSRTGFLDSASPVIGAGSWSNGDFNWNNNSINTGVTISGVEQQPRFVVEEVTSIRVTGSEGSAIDFESQMTYEEAVHYRITTRAVGANPNTVVILQSMFKR